MLACVGGLAFQDSWKTELQNTHTKCVYYIKLTVKFG